MVNNDLTNSRVPQTLLLVDDVPANLDVLLEHLQNEQVRLLAATSGRDALRLALHDPPDLILLDVMMPDMDGYEVLRQLKDHTATREVPVIFVTAMSDSVDETRGLAMGAVDYIAKPFVVPVLKARVKNHLELKRKSDLLAHLAQIDGLTGISNRRHLMTRVGQEWDRCQRHGRPLSLVMIDVDHFKPFNDHYGHGHGDDCLRNVSRALSACCRRSGDMLARYGGIRRLVARHHCRTGCQDRGGIAKNGSVAGNSPLLFQFCGCRHRQSWCCHPDTQQTVHC